MKRDHFTVWIIIVKSSLEPPRGRNSEVLELTQINIIIFIIIIIVNMIICNHLTIDGMSVSLYTLESSFYCETEY